MDKPNHKFFSIGEAAEAIGVSIDTLRRWDAEGKFRPAYVSPGKHRYYRKIDVDLFLNDVFALAGSWATSPVPSKPESDFYCSLKPVFQSRLERFQDELKALPGFAEKYSLVVGAAAEMGNNSFDHNLGNWIDVPGIFFGYDLNKRKVALADRGRGVRATLSRIRPGLRDDGEALKVAFTEIISGRAPENRGNGLKYVRAIVAGNSMRLTFRSGNAQTVIANGSSELEISRLETPVPGCLALLEF